MKIKSGIGIIILIISSVSTAVGQYNIQIQTKGWKNNPLILGYYSGNNMYVVDTALMDVNGKAVFKADTLLPKGIYTAYYPNEKFFDFLVGQKQNISIKTDTINFLGSQQVSGNPETAAFLEYHQFMGAMQQQKTKLINRFNPYVKNNDSLMIARKKLDDLNKIVENKWNEELNRLPGSFYQTIIRSFIPVKVPEFDVPAFMKNRDSIIAVKQYNYNATHYFDNTNLSEPGLWRTPFHVGKIDYYLNSVLIQRPDSILRHALNMIEKSRKSSQTFRMMASHLLNYSVNSDIMGMEMLSVAIAKNYYLTGKATWADSTLLVKLAELVAKEEYTLLGKKAPELVMEDWQSVAYHSLHQVRAPYTILIFFEPNCSHCKKTIPEINQQVFSKYRDKGLAVYCVYTQRDKKEWSEFIIDYELYDWTHVWDPRNSTNFRYYYDVSVTPRIFLLDKDKKIIGKKIGVENLLLMLDRLYTHGTL
jgi:hypothetical protein